MNTNTEDRQFFAQLLSGMESRLYKEIENMEKGIRGDVATKSNLIEMENRIRADMTQIEQNIRSEMATKDDLIKLENRLSAKIENEIEHLARLFQDQFIVVRKEFA